MPQAAIAQGGPTVTGVSPSVGPDLGGTIVTITGTNFLNPDSLVVKFGSTGSGDYTVVSSTEITATSPENTTGGGASLTVDVTVTTSYGTSPTSTADHFTYSPNPTATPDPASSVSQASATLNGAVNPEGWDVTECEFGWGQVEAGGGVSFTYTPCAQPPPFTGTSAVPVSLNLSGLSLDTTYDYLLYLQYSCDQDSPCAYTSSEGSFTTLPDPPVVVTNPASGVSQTQATLNATVNPNGAAVSTCQFQWGTTTSYGNTATCAQTVGSGTSAVPVSANLTALSPNTTYHYRILASSSSTSSYGTDQTFSTQPTSTVSASTFSIQPGPPTVSVSPPSVSSSSESAFSGTVNPDGSSTIAYFQYGLDSKYSGSGDSVAYTQSTPVQQVGAGGTPVPVSASVSGLVPNALYHVRLVASNGAGTTYGPDQRFTTFVDPPPPPPVLGKAVDVSPISGLVLIKPPPGKSLGTASDSAALSKGQGFVPLTEARQIPTGSEIDALHGSLQMVTATGTVGKTQTATLTGGIFKLTQDRTGITKGLTDFTLQESAFQGAPTYGTCKAKYKATDATIASLSSKTLQLLKVSAHGKFKTTGRYSSATVRGTIWTIADRCDGTLTHVIRDTVLVDDFVRHTTILLHAGQSYLAKKP
jgi:IPT/TIG domain